MYRASVWHTSNENISYVTPELPVIRIAGKEFKGLDAYKHLGKRICAAYSGPDKPVDCGCSAALDDAAATRAFLAGSSQRSSAVTATAAPAARVAVELHLGVPLHWSLVGRAAPQTLVRLTVAVKHNAAGAKALETELLRRSDPENALYAQASASLYSIE